tara:strand:+ start:1138 stop:1434 length:297 start_codon:yes stop_codon:yes gene_type:complete
MKLINILTAIAVVIGAFSFYLFYFSDCSEVKQYWYLTHTPARCTLQEAQPQTPADRGMCLVGVYQPESFRLQETSAGHYEYEIYVTTAGIEVWESCNQ